MKYSKSVSKAIRHLEQLADSRSEKVQLAASTRILDFHERTVAQDLEKAHRRDAELKAEVAALRSQVTDLRAQLESLTAQMGSKDSEIASLKTQLQDSQLEIASLRLKLTDAEKTKPQAVIAKAEPLPVPTPVAPAKAFEEIAADNATIQSFRRENRTAPLFGPVSLNRF